MILTQFMINVNIDREYYSEIDLKAPKSRSDAHGVFLNGRSRVESRSVSNRLYDPFKWKIGLRGIL